MRVIQGIGGGMIPGAEGAALTCKPAGEGEAVHDFRGQGTGVFTR